MVLGFPETEAGNRHLPLCRRSAHLRQGRSPTSRGPQHELEHPAQHRSQMPLQTRSLLRSAHGIAYGGSVLIRSAHILQEPGFEESPVAGNWLGFSASDASPRLPLRMQLSVGAYAATSDARSQHGSRRIKVLGIEPAISAEANPQHPRLRLPRVRRTSRFLPPKFWSPAVKTVSDNPAPTLGWESL